MPQQLSKPIKGSEAYALGLVDAIVPPEELVDTARRWALDIVEYRKPWIRSLYKTDKIEPLGEAREILKFARTQAQKQAANLQHPLVCIDVIEEGIVSGPRAGLWKVSLALLFSCTVGISFNYLILISTFCRKPSLSRSLFFQTRARTWFMSFFLNVQLPRSVESDLIERLYVSVCLL